MHEESSPLHERANCCAGSMFNHSSRPNIDYRVGVNELIISFYAARDIEQGAGSDDFQRALQSGPRLAKSPSQHTASGRQISCTLSRLLACNTQCVVSGEELFIFYGSTLWFEDHASPAISIAAGSPVHNHVDDPAGFLRSFQLCSDPVLSTDNV